MIPHAPGYLAFETLSPLPGLRHVVTTRLVGNAEDGARARGTLGFGAGVDPRDVIENRRRAASAIEADARRLTVPGQAHTAAVAIVGSADAGRGAVEEREAIPETDGLATREPGLPLLVQSADCVPILLVDARRGALAVVHAGWRGSLAGIARRAVEILTGPLGCNPEDLRAGVGPSIGPCCYEVGDDVVSAFARDNPDGLAYITRRGGRAHLDLWALNGAQLVAAGMQPDRIETARACTRCDGRFFSVRRDGRATGRFGLLARLS